MAEHDRPSEAHDSKRLTEAQPPAATDGAAPSARLRTIRWPVGLLLAALGGVLASLTLHPSYIGRWLHGSWFGVPDFGWLAWVAFVPALVAVGAAPRVRGAFLRGFVFAGTWFLLTCAFIIQVHWVGWLAGALGFGLKAGVIAIAIWGVARAGGRWAVVIWPFAWIFGDWAIGHVGIKFPWLYAAYSQIDLNPWLVQTADLFGVYGTSWLIIAVNAWIAVLILDRRGLLVDSPGERVPVATAEPSSADAEAARRPTPWPEVLRRYGVHAVALGVLLVAAHVYGAVRLATLDERPGPVVALMQNNVPIGLQRERPAASLIVERMDELLRAVAATGGPGTRRDPALALQPWRERYPYVRDEMVVTRTAPRTAEDAAAGRPLVDLVVFPENFPLRHRLYELSRVPGREPTYWDNQFQRLVDRLEWLDAYWLLNSIELSVDVRDLVEEADRVDYDAWLAEHRAANTATLIAPGGETRGRYVKIELVPVGEYVPLREVTSLTRDLTELTIGKDAPDYTFGTTRTVFAVPMRANPNAAAVAAGMDDSETVKFASPICFESNFPSLLRSFVRAGAEMFVIQSDDGWFIPSNEPEQVWLGARFRAIENRVSVARAVSSGHTGVVGPDGRFRARLFGEYDGESRTWGFPGVLIAEVPRGPARSLYLVVGDVLPAAAFLLTVVGLVVAWRRRRVRAQ